jgi:hypothetical protein
MNSKIHFEDTVDPEGSAKGIPRIAHAIGSFGTPIELKWPTDYQVITQAFGANPELHAERNLPGHEGLDIRAPANSNIYAAANGKVETIHVQDSDEHPYGRFVTLAHQDGYLTTYGHLGRVLVSKGQNVTQCSVIANAGKTGLTNGGHIHFSLSKQGATANGLTHLPDDIIDPTPFLSHSTIERDACFYPWSFGRCLNGVFLREEDSIDLVSAEAVLMDSELKKEKIVSLKSKRANLFLMTQLPLPKTSKPISPSEWTAWVSPSVQRHIQAGVGYFSMLNTPNLTGHGLGLHWNTGEEFGRWWTEAVSLLKTNFPAGRFGFPALSPGEQIIGQRLDADIFMEGADEAMLSADWLGVMCKWGTPQKMQDEAHGLYYSKVRRYYPEHLLFVTSFGNADRTQDEAAKQREASQYFDLIKKEPGIGATFYKT